MHLVVSTVVFAGREWIVPAVALFAISFAIVLWRYSHAKLDSRAKWMAASAKGLTLSVLCVCLLDPLWSAQRVQPGANLFAILADNSESLSIRDPGSNDSRGGVLKKLLTDEKASWQTRLAQDFDLRRYTFDSRLQSVADFSEMEFSGSRTNLQTVLSNLKTRFKNRPLAGVLLFTDGIATDWNSASLDLSGLPPIYPVVIGDQVGHRDLSVSHLSATTTSFEDAPVTIQADVSQIGLAKTKVTATVFDEAGKVLKEESQSFGSDSSPLAFRFQIKPTKSGLSFYEVRVISDAIDLIAESTSANNRRQIAVDRGTGPYRILYLSGRPNWEFKFLRRSIETDEQIQLTGVIRVAKREPKFDWRSKAGEATNPLFRGFDRTSEETERYDQPVMVRLNTRDPNEFRDGFPKKLEELYQFHAVIIDDLESGFFSADQLSMLERFVSERGGGLLMLGGAESYSRGAYDRTPVGRMMPVYLAAEDVIARSSAQPVFRLKMTRDGWLQPWFRLRSTETEEQQRLNELPYFRTLNNSGGLKPGASIIAEATDANGNNLPAVAVQRFGRGRCSAVLIGDFWRWHMERTDSQREKDDPGKAWRQMLRWLISDVPDRMEVKVSSPKGDWQTLRNVEVRVRANDFQPLFDAMVTAELPSSAENSIKQNADPSLGEAGLYEFPFSSNRSGRQVLQVEAVDAQGNSVGKSTVGWVNEPALEEFQRVAPQVEILKNIAQRTGGENIKITQIGRLIEELPSRHAPMTVSYATPLWHNPYVLLIVAAGLMLEWAFRRYRGMP